MQTRCLISSIMRKCADSAAGLTLKRAIKILLSIIYTSFNNILYFIDEYYKLDI